MSVDFLKELVNAFATRSIGVDLSSINFDGVDDASLLHDETTLKEIFEILHHSANQTDISSKKAKEADLSI